LEHTHQMKKKKKEGKSAALPWYIFQIKTGKYVADSSASCLIPNL
jgi:hypothetical protein